MFKPTLLLTAAMAIFVNVDGKTIAGNPAHAEVDGKSAASLKKICTVLNF